MLVINFSHPLTDSQQQQLEQLTGQAISRVVHRPAQFDPERSFPEQTRELIDSVGLSPEAWQTERLLVISPSLAAMACCVLAELHGRAGYFPPIIRLRPVAGRVPPEFQVAELIDLQEVRNTARTRRSLSL